MIRYAVPTAYWQITARSNGCSATTSIAVNSTPRLCSRYFARLQAPIRASTLATSVACSIFTPSISSRRSVRWIPAFRPGLAGFTYSASTLPCRSTQITPSSGSRKWFCCSKLMKADTPAARVSMVRIAVDNWNLSSWSIVAAGAVEETITPDIRSTFDAAINPGFYNQIILTFYSLQAAPGNLLRFLGEIHYAEVYPAATVVGCADGSHPVPQTRTPYPARIYARARSLRIRTDGTPDR